MFKILFSLNTGFLTSLCALSSLISVSSCKFCSMVYFLSTCLDCRGWKHVSLHRFLFLFGETYVHPNSCNAKIEVHVCIVYSNSMLATLNARKKIRKAAGINTASDNMSLSLRVLPKSTISSKAKSDTIPTMAGSHSQHYS